MTPVVVLSALAAAAWGLSAVLTLRARRYVHAAVCGLVTMASAIYPLTAGGATYVILPLLLSAGAAITFAAALRTRRGTPVDRVMSRHLFDSLPDPAVIWKIQTDRTIVLERANRAAHALGTETLKQYIGMPVNEFFAHEPHMADYVHEAFSTGKPRRVELLYTFRRSAGTRWIQADYVRLTEDRVLNSVRDISDRKEAEQALSEQEERLRRLYEATFEGIGFTENGVIIDANRQLADMLGYPLVELIGRTSAECIDQQATGAITDGGGAIEGFAFEHRARRKDGHSFPVEVRSRIVRVGGRELGVLVVRNLTARRRSEHLLRESEENYRELAESITDVFLAADRDLAVTHWNKASEYLTGITTRDAVGRHLFDLLPHLRGSEAESLLADTLSTREALSCVISYQAGDRTIPFELRTYPTRKGVAVFLEDITTLKRTEDELKASLKEKEVLLREIHHRVKNNLQIISSLLSLQAEHLTGERAMEALLESQNRIRSMAIIHEQLYGTENLGRIDLERYIRDLTAHVFRSHSLQAGRVSLGLELEPVDLGIDRAIPCGIIINELVTNCLKHAFRGRDRGTVRVQLTRRAQAGIRLVVADDGTGMPEGIDLSAGPSLGLKLVHTLTEQLRGELHVQIKNGTTFEVLFPG